MLAGSGGNSKVGTLVNTAQLLSNVLDTLPSLIRDICYTILILLLF